MPHLSEIQEKFADQGVLIISVSDEKLEQVESFLEKNVRGKDDQTYAELTNNYCLTVDPDRSVHKDYFAAAGQRGIPCAFIVGKTGKIEWIGHPMRMDSPLQQVVDDEWDRDAYLVEYNLVEYKAQKKREAQQMLLMGLARSVGQKAKAGKFDAALEAIDDPLENDKFDFATAQLESIREQVLKLQEEKEKADAEKAAAEKADAEKSADETDNSDVADDE